MYEFKVSSHDYSTGSGDVNDAQLNAIAKDGWEIADTSLSYPYLGVLWRRAIPEKKKAEPEPEPEKKPEPKPEPKPAAKRSGAR